ncbi:SRPBCC domain-containing protein [Blastococcus sp. TF02A-30]|uniref:SRPBCC domain-containing protein n=1 Tax=Blastococcus sp. TF02A-30 TaxID=2250580 RepID=UPI000DE937AA|nr:SRPBCC domain-containing protein [Blastococcus sp. TF02A-30]RBY87776.1 SRPBCC domain-containing protein [Blastococcus sp. TF02A-30]
MREISVTTSIAAPPQVVWAELTDTGSYGTWNPFIPELSGELREGARLRVRIVPPGGSGMTFRPTVTTVEEGHRLAWLGRLGVPGLFDGTHSFTLTPRADGGTDLTQREEFRGLLVPLFGGTLAKTEAGFAGMNEALKVRAEERGRR